MRNTKPDTNRQICWILLTVLVFTISLTTMAQVIPQMIKPLSLQVGTKNYTLLYRNGAQGKQLIADLQDKSGIAGHIMLLQRGAITAGTLYMQNGRNYSITISDTKTNLVMLPTPPVNTNANCMVEPTAKVLAAAKRPNVLKARQGARAMLFKPGDDVYSVPVATPDNIAPIDILFVYTAAAASSVGGVTNLINIAHNAIAEAQQSYTDSHVYIKLNLLGIVPISFTEVGDLYKDVNAIAVPDTETYKLREQYNADILCMYAWEPKSCYSGMTIANRRTDLAYIAVEPIYDNGNFVTDHEIGHVLGCDHDRDNGCGAANYSYSYGYKWPGLYNYGWRSVMAYPNGIRVGYFSSPNILDSYGFNTGTSTENNALTLNQCAWYVSSFRDQIGWEVNVSQNGSGSVTSDGNNVNASVNVQKGQTTTLTATGNFLCWSGDINAGTPSITITPTNNLTVIANFVDGTWPLAPQITVQPLSQNVPQNETLQLSVQGFGIPTPTFQWKKNGVNISSIGAILTIPNATSINQGTYTCSAINNQGTAISSQAVVTVGQAPLFLQQPISQIAFPSGDVMFDVVMDTLDVKYQWYFNGNSIPTETNSDLYIDWVEPSDMGTYYVEATSATKTVRSLEAKLVLVSPATISKQPIRANITNGQSTTLTIAATGIEPVVYQWYKDGVAVANATNTQLTFTSAKTNVAGVYQVIVNNPIGITVSAEAPLTVADPLTITTQPTSITAKRGETPIIQFAATGSQPVTYQWYQNDAPIQDQVYTTCRLKNIQTNQAGTYYVIVSNPSGTLQSAKVQVTVLDPAAITAQPTSATIDEGNSASLSVGTDGKQPIKYTWYQNSKVVGNNSSTFDIISASKTDIGNYQVAITNADGGTKSATVTVSVNTAPAITTQPVNANANMGATATFTVVATGVAPLTYQWFFNEQPLAGTSATLTVPNVQNTSAGNYYVIVNNRLGTATSATVTLTAHDPPKIVTPSNISVDEGDTLTVAPTVTGALPMTYSWTKNSQIMSDQTSPVLTISNFRSNNVAYYALTAKNADGATTSGNIQPALQTAPRFTLQPVAVTITNGGTVKFTTTATGTTPITYQWQKDGSDIEGGNSATFTIAQATLGDEGTYSVTVANRLGTTNSSNAKLTLLYPPTITGQSESTTITAGDPLTLAVTADGHQPFTYTWQRNSTTISGANSDTFTISATKTTDSGTYRVGVANKDGTVWSANMTITVIAKPTVATQPADITVIKGANGQLTASFTSATPCTYQWAFNGEDIADATSATLALTAIQPSQEGQYTLTAYNPAGSATTRTAIVTVKEPPVFVTQPISTAVKAGETLTLSALATSDITPITYQWIKGTTSIPGQTQSDLTITNVSSTIAGTYKVTATNQDGSASSASATVTFQTQPPTFTTDLPTTMSVDPASTLTLQVIVSGIKPMTYRWTFKGQTLVLQTNDTLNIDNVKTNNAGTYQVTVSNADGSKASTACAVSIIARPPVFATQPIGATVPRGGTNVFSITMNNPVQMSYQWMRNGTAIPGETNLTLTVTNIQNANVGSYSVQASNDYGIANSSVVTLQLIDKPTIINDLLDVLTTNGASVQFAVTATGTDTKYTWLFNGNNQAWTTATATIAKVNTNNQGQYQVGVYNVAGTNWSQTATLTLKVPPTITQQPSNTLAKTGQNATFSVIGTGRGDLRYQWLFNSNIVLNATNTILVISNAQAKDTGTYSVTVSGADGNINSQNATLTVDTEPVITTQPLDVHLTTYSKVATFNVVATSKTGLSYQWLLNGEPITGATLSALTISNATTSQEGNYQAVVTNKIGATTSQVAVLTLAKPPVITAQPGTVEATIGNSATISVSVTGNAPISYQWQRMGVNIVGATNSFYTIPMVQTTDLTSYSVTIGNNDGNTTSATGYITLAAGANAAPAILTQPSDATIDQNQSTNLSVLAAGSEPLSYIWSQNGTNLANSNTNSFAIKTAKWANNGIYNVTVSNAYGVALSSNITVAVHCPPVFTSLPTNFVAIAGTPFSLSVGVANANNLTWKLNGFPYGTPNQSQLNWNSISTNEIGNYSLLATNSYGSIETAIFAVDVKFAPQITTQPKAVTTLVSSNATLSVIATGSGTLTYQWNNQSSPISDATNATLTLKNLQLTDSSYFSVTITSPYGTITSIPTSITVNNPPDTAPVVLIQPKNASVNKTNPVARLYVVAGDSQSTMNYAWTLNTKIIAGATNSSLVISNATANDEGDYQAILRNDVGTTASQIATVRVAQPPVITAQPSSTNALVGGTVSMTISATGRSPLSYQWKQNGTTISGATTTTLTVANIQETDWTAYTVVITNLDGSIESQPANITETPTAPTITSATGLIEITNGTSFTLAISAKGTKPLNYSWNLNGTTITGQTQSVLTVSSANTANTGNYTITVNNAYGTAVWTNTQVNLVYAPSIISQVTNMLGAQGSTLTLSVNATNTTGYIWKKNGTTIAQGTNAQWIISNAKTNDSGTYTVICTNNVASVTSQPISVDIKIAPSIVSNPIGMTTTKGSNVTLSVSATGTAPLNYQWRLNGDVIAGATQPTLTLTNVPPTASGYYSVTVSSPYGTNTSANAQVVVNTPVDVAPIIVAQPQGFKLNTTNQVGTLSVTASNSYSTLTYQWYKDGSVITGATQNTLNVTNAIANEGSYQVAIQNIAGTTASQPVTVLVAQPPVITVQPAGTNCLIGGTATLTVSATGRSPLSYQWSKGGVTVGQNASLTLANVQSTDFGSYTVTITNTDGTITSQTATITETPVVPAITSTLTTVQVVAGTSTNLNVIATGTKPLTYQWSLNGTRLANQTQSSLTISSAKATDAGAYSVTVTNAYGSATATNSIVTVLFAPGIISQSTNLTAIVGGSFTLNVVASNATSTTWTKNGVTVGNTAQITISNLQTNDAGNYTVTVSNNVGSVSGQPITVTVMTPPNITSNPIGVTVTNNNNITLSVTATGSAPLNYQWSLNGTAVTGATQSTLPLTNIQTNNAGYYTVTVSSPYGTITSSPALVVVNTIIDVAPTITTQPQGLQFSATNLTGTLTVVATSGVSSNTYQWYKDGSAINGATLSVYTISNATATTEGSYQVIVKNAVGTVSSQPATVTVAQPPTITKQPTSTNTAIGGTVTLTVTATGRSPLAYSWSKSGSLVGQTASLTLANVQSTDLGNYSVTISNTDGTVTSQSATITETTTAPTITYAPTTISLIAGDTTNLNVTATGTKPLTYQWSLNGTKMVGQTQAVMTITSAKASDAGKYSVTVTNNYGTTTWSNTVVTVLTAPVITSQPTNLTGIQGATLTINVTSTNATQFSWSKDGNTLSAYTGSTLTIASATTNDAGSYTITCSNLAGATISQPITVAIYVSPAITAQPAGITTIKSSNVTLNVTATGSSPLTYQWLLNGTTISGATQNALTLANVQTNNSGNYSVVVTNPYGSVTSATAIVVVNNPTDTIPTITAQPQGLTLTKTNLNGSLSVTAGTSISAITYQWYKNGVAINSATQNVFNITNATANDEASYQVAVQNGSGKVLSQTVTVTVAQPPVITIQPTGTNTAIGGTVTLTVTATGRSPLAYSWSKSGILIGQTASLTLANVQSTELGNYSVTITNTDGTVTSQTATITETTTAPTITYAPDLIALVAGDTTNVTVTATGTKPLTYQWSANGSQITGQTQAVMTISSAKASHAGKYSVTVTNNYGKTIWSNTTVTVLTAPVITSQPTNLTAIQGSSLTISIVTTNATKFSWSKDGNKLSAYTGSTLTIASATTNDAGSYTLTCSNLAGATISQPITVAIYVAPIITAQPAGITTIKSSNVTLNVTATGSSPLTYQWLLNGTTISGATQNALTLANVQTNNSGNYSVVVTNPYGSVTSATAIVVVNNPADTIPTITAQPQGLTLTKTNLNGSLSVTAGTSISAITYQWYKNGVAINGATQSVFNITNATANDEASYQVAVQNGAGKTLSQTITVTVAQPPVIIAGPGSTQVGMGKSFNLWVSATGRSPLNYQWFRNGSALANGTGTNVTVGNTTTNDLGAYTVTISNTDGTVTSGVANVTEAPTAPAIVAHPQNAKVFRGQATNLTASATGTAPLSYQWQKGATNLIGQTNSTLTISSAIAGDIGTYTLTVSNAYGTAISSNATITVAFPPTIVSQVTNLTGIQGASLAISVNVSNATSYSWTKNGTTFQGTQPTVTFAIISTNDIGNYILTASNEVGTVTSQPITLDVKVAPAIVTQPVGNTVIKGTNVTFTVSATGTAPLTYQWFVGITTITNATNSTLTLNSVQTNNSGYYSVRVNSSWGSVTSTPALLTVNNPADTYPIITTQPKGLTLNASTNSGTLSVVATAQSTITYQWTLNNVSINGATQNVFNINNATGAQEGTYKVVLLNAVGTTVSDPAIVTVAQPPVITINPMSQQVIPGKSVTLTVTATGRSPLAYQWKKGGTSIANATTASLLLSNAQTSTFGTYTVTITNTDGSATSTGAVITEAPQAPTIVINPQSVVVPKGRTTNLTVSATGTLPLLYQWQKNSTNLVSQTNATLTISSADVIDTGAYSLVVSNAYGSVISSNATIIVALPPSIISQPTNLTGIQGNNVTIKVTTTNATSYIWSKNGTVIQGNQDSVIFSAITTNDIGTYTLSISNDIGSVTSQPITMDVKVAPAIVIQPVGATIITGTNITLSVTATGTAPLTYQWAFGSTTISGATATTLTLNSPQTTNSGYYSVRVSSTWGSITSTPVLLTVNNPPDTYPTIVNQPKGLTLSPTNNSGTLSITAGTSQSALSFQWTLNNVTIAGATQNVFSISNATGAQEGTYRAVLQNAVGTTVSDPATVTVAQPPVITTSPVGQQVIIGNNFTLTTVATGRSPLAYKWQKDGVTLTGATGTTLLVTNTQLSNLGGYTVVVTNTDGTTTSATATITESPVAPTITAQPVTTTITKGNASTLSVTAKGTALLTYQWQKNGTNLTGQTYNTLQIASASTSDNGTYCVTVTNGYGTVKSSNAIITVLSPPAIISQPTNLVAIAGTNLIIAPVTTNGTTFTWKKGTSVIAQTNAQLILTSITTNDAGTYTFNVANTVGSVDSQPIVVDVKIAPAITVAPVGMTTTTGSNINLSVTAIGSGTLSYEWRFNSTVISGTSNTWVCANAQTNQSGYYSVRVYSTYGSVTSNPVLVSVNNPGDTVPVITTQPLGIWLKPTNCTTGYVFNPKGDDFHTTTNGTLTVIATSKTKMTYQWYKDGTAINCATQSIYSVTNIVATNEANYQVQIKNSIGTICSDNAFVYIVQPPKITMDLTNISVKYGDPFTLSIQATGRQPIDYGWIQNNNTFLNCRNSNYTVIHATTNDFGTYVAQAYNDDTYGIASSTITVSQAPSAPLFTSQPTNTLIKTGNTGSLSTTANAVGMGTITYQWNFNGNSVANATNAILTITNVGHINEGTYTVTIANQYGSITSSNAILTVMDLPTILSYTTTNTAIHSGGTFALSVVATNTTGFYWYRDGICLQKTVTNTLTTQTNIYSTYGWPNNGTYTVTCSNRVGTTISSIMIVEAYKPPYLTGQSADKTMGSGNFTTLYVNTEGNQLNFQWYCNDTKVPNATDSRIYTGTDGYYYCIITNQYGSVQSSNNIFNVIAPPTLTSVVITNRDTNVITFYQGDRMEFATTVSSRSPLTYNWFKSRTPSIYEQPSQLAVPNTASLVITNIQPNDSGYYEMHASSSYGSVQTERIAIRVMQKPFITSAPLTLSLSKNDPLKLTPGIGVQENTTATWALTGFNIPTSYQWAFNGNIIPNETNTFLYIQFIKASQSGAYTIIVSNPAGVCTGNVAVVTVKEPVIIAIQPASRSAALGDTVQLTVLTTGSGPITYQWSKNGVLIGGMSTNTLTLNNITASDAANYSVAVANAYGTAQSKVATLTIIAPPVITKQPKDTRVITGGTTNLSVDYTCTGTATIQWYFEDEPITGATNKTLTITNTDVEDEGDYYVEIAGLGGITPSTNVSLTLSYPPTIVKDLQDKVVSQGQTAELEVVVDGLEPMTYIWRKNNQVIVGPNTRILAFNNIQTLSAGNYTVTVSNIDGTITSRSAKITVNPLPTITQQPVTTIVTIGDTLLLHVSATAPTTLTYQWLKDGTNLVGMTNNLLTITNAQIVNQGTYQVKVSTIIGSVLSDATTVLVLPAQPNIIPPDPNLPVIISITNSLKGEKVIIFYGAIGKSYKVQASTNSTTWTTLATIAAKKNINSYIDKDWPKYTNRIYGIELVGGSSGTQTNNMPTNLVATILLTGQGSLTPNYVNRSLTNGGNYKVTAVESVTGFKFANWTGSITTTNKTISFIMSNDFQVTANFVDVQPPKLTIVTPKNNIAVSNYNLIVTGTASDNVNVANVYYRVNGGDWQRAIGTINWQSTLILSGGTNRVDAKAIDDSGNESVTNITTTYIPCVLASVKIVGGGTVTPNYNNTYIQIGKMYSMTATPATNQWFKGWSGSGNSTAKTITFIVNESANANFTATFMTNPYIKFNGTYTGLYCDQDQPQAGGYIKVTVTKDGKFTGLLQGAVQGSCRGTFQIDGSAIADNMMPTPLWLQMNMETGVTITGKATASGAQVPMRADRCIFDGTTNTAPQAGKYDMVIGNPDDEYGMYATATITISAKGLVTVAGQAQNTLPFSQGTTLACDGIWPLFTSFNKTNDTLMGWVQADNATLTGNAIWTRMGTKALPGFTNNVQMTGTKQN